MNTNTLRLAAASIAVLLVSTTAQARTHHRAHHHRAHVVDANGNGVTYLPHPPGVRGSAFCGAGAHYALTGEVVNAGTWAIASYWPGHYHGSTPVAYWPHGHVAIIRQMYGDGTALLEDYNSGNHQSRLWRRSIAGAQILGGGGNAYASADSGETTRHHSSHTYSARRHRGRHGTQYATAQPEIYDRFAIH